MLTTTKADEFNQVNISGIIDQMKSLNQSLEVTTQEAIKMSKILQPLVTQASLFVVGCASNFTKKNSLKIICAESPAEAIMEYVFDEIGDTLYNLVRLCEGHHGMIAILKKHGYFVSAIEITNAK